MGPGGSGPAPLSRLTTKLNSTISAAQGLEHRPHRGIMRKRHQDVVEARLPERVGDTREGPEAPRPLQRHVVGLDRPDHVGVQAPPDPVIPEGHPGAAPGAERGQAPHVGALGGTG